MKSARFKSDLASKPKAKGTSRASKPSKSAAKSKSQPKAGTTKAGTKATPGGNEARRLKLLARASQQLAKVAGDAPGNAGTKSRKQATGKSASRLSARDLVDWREETLARMRALILEADPDMIEERKWRKPSNAMTGVPVWSHNGIVCTGETYTKVVKLTFAQGASIPDPSRLFNSSLEGNMRRAIDIHEGEKINTAAFKALVKAAVAKNGAASKKR